MLENPQNPTTQNASVPYRGLYEPLNPTFGGQLHALVASADRIASSLLNKALSSSGWTVTEADDSKLALAELLPRTGLVVLDAMLPQLEPREILPQMQALAPRSNFVYLSDEEDHPEDAAALRASFFDQLSRPLDPVHLTEICARAEQALSGAGSGGEGARFAV